ncbi:MAG TPA: molybdopterin-dependent oxidoreductase [Thermoanaerobaculia bacterium]|nr:molybdopterin-dependent oxidoreductase [Thermoanaerobaculia bacterium]
MTDVTEVVEPAPEEEPEQPEAPPPPPSIDKELQRLSRRGFLVFGAGSIAAYAGWKLLSHATRIGDVQWPLRRGFETNEKLAAAYFKEKRLSPTFPPSARTYPRINGGVGLHENYDTSTWNLNMDGHTLTLEEIKAFPKREMITEFRCIEGWSYIAKWSGARLSDVMAKFPPRSNTPYVAMETPGAEYYVGLDMQSAMHPQTLLAYELNDQPLTWQHGSPLRLAIPVKYGIKNIKRIATIRYTNIKPADYWAERGYDWYSGH